MTTPRGHHASGLDPMDHRDLIATLSPQQRSALRKRSDYRALVHLTLHLGAISGLGWMIVERVTLWPALMVPQGILVVFLFAPLHETIHRTAFETRWLNNVVARVCGFLLLLPAGWFRCFHFAHHRHTQDPENDPELAVPKPDTLVRYLFHITGLSVWWSQTRTLARNGVGRCDDAFVDAADVGGIRREARLTIAAYVALAVVSIASGMLDLLYVWIVPALLGQPLLRLFLLAEHAGCNRQGNMLTNSRTTITTRVVRWLAWNMPYHAEHHTLPSVPYHRLPSFHNLTRPQLGHREDGYLRFHANFLRELVDRSRSTSR